MIVFQSKDPYKSRYLFSLDWLSFWVWLIMVVEDPQGTPVPTNPIQMIFLLYAMKLKAQVLNEGFFVDMNKLFFIFISCKHFCYVV